MDQRPFIVGVGGFTSNVGKTTLMCELLRAFPGWEAIKTTRGHYRSCGKDPHACCVSHLLSDHPLVRSDRHETDAPGKDTGRYWDAGASNVHWLIATDEQIGPGIKEALSRVTTAGVFVEGNSFTQTIAPDLFIMVMRNGELRMKATAKRALDCVSTFYVSDSCDQQVADSLRAQLAHQRLATDSDVFTAADLPVLIERINERFFQLRSSFRRTILEAVAS